MANFPICARTNQITKVGNYKMKKMSVLKLGNKVKYLTANTEVPGTGIVW